MINLEQNYSLKNYNTFGIDVQAEFFTKFENVAILQQILRENQDKKLLILGGGSNLLFTQNFAGLVLKNEIKGIEILKENEAHIYLKVGAGEHWHDFVMYCVAHGFAGVENLALIPGTVGAAPMQNIGAYGVEVREVLEKVEALHIKTKEIQEFTNSDCKFGYRESIFKNTHKDQYIISHVYFRLHKKPKFNVSYGAIQQTLEAMNISELSIQAIAEAVIQIRQSKLPDPAQIGNAGSFFKNPEIDKSHFEELKQKFPDMVSYPLDNGKVKVPAGWLIDQAGWKGKRLGEIGVHEKQALVLVNYGNGKGQDLKELSEKIQANIQEIYGIDLKKEVNLV